MSGVPEKIEIDFELFRDLVDAAGWVGNFYTDLCVGATQEYHADWGAVQYLASEAVLIEQRGRAVLEAVEQGVQPTLLESGENEGDGSSEKSADSREGI